MQHDASGIETCSYFLNKWARNLMHLLWGYNSGYGQHIYLCFCPIKTIYLTGCLNYSYLCRVPLSQSSLPAITLTELSIFAKTHLMVFALVHTMSYNSIFKTSLSFKDLVPKSSTQFSFSEQILIVFHLWAKCFASLLLSWAKQTSFSWSLHS